MNILITGIGGYIGKNLVSCLNGIQNFNIYGLDIKKEKIEGVKKIYLWDELEKIDDICCVIHLAGLAHDLIGLNSLSNYLSINLGLTQKIFEWSIDRRVEKFIFFSSVKAVSDKPNSILKETDLKNPGTPYGISKSRAEDFLLQNCKKVDKLYILRPVMIYGPGCKGI